MSNLTYCIDESIDNILTVIVLYNNSCNNITDSILHNITNYSLEETDNNDNDNDKYYIIFIIILIISIIGCYMLMYIICSSFIYKCCWRSVTNKIYPSL